MESTIEAKATEEMTGAGEVKRKTKMKEKYMPGEDMCKYFIPRKQRQCGQPTDKSSKDFCRFHMSMIN
jgi:hypothetical protein